MPLPWAYQRFIYWPTLVDSDGTTAFYFEREGNRALRILQEMCSKCSSLFAGIQQKIYKNRGHERRNVKGIVQMLMVLPKRLQYLARKICAKAKEIPGNRICTQANRTEPNQAHFSCLPSANIQQKTQQRLLYKQD